MGDNYVACPLVVVPANGIPWYHRETFNHGESRLNPNILAMYRAEVVGVDGSRVKKYVRECKGRRSQEGQDPGHNAKCDFPFARRLEDQRLFVTLKFVHDLISFLLCHSLTLYD